MSNIRRSDTGRNDLVGIHAIAEMAGVTHEAVANWRTRFPEFPKPVAELGDGPMFRQAEVRRWLAYQRSHALGTRVKSYVYPLLVEDEEARPQTIASCVHVGVGESRFLVTVAHAWDDIRQTHSYLGIAGRSLRSVPIQRLTALKSAKYDLALVPLDPQAIEQMIDCPYVTPDAFDLDMTALAPLYVATGFPATQSRPQYRRRIMRPTVMAYTGVPAPAEVYEKLRLELQDHIAIKFRRRRVAGATGLQTAPEPKGMSGGGFWSVSEADPNNPKLAGIGCDYPAADIGRLRESHVLVAVRILFVLVMLRQSQPHLAKHLPPVRRITSR